MSSLCSLPSSDTISVFGNLIKSSFGCQVVRGVVESLKIITRQASLRVAEYAFHYAKTNGRQRVSAIHKANIMRKTDGLFLKVYCCRRKPQIGKRNISFLNNICLQCCREIAEKYPDITYEEVIIDNCCMMVMSCNPTFYPLKIRYHAALIAQQVNFGSFCCSLSKILHF